jgi:polyferredoxin
MWPMELNPERGFSQFLFFQFSQFLPSLPFNSLFFSFSFLSHHKPMARIKLFSSCNGENHFLLNPYQLFNSHQGFNRTRWFLIISKFYLVVQVIAMNKVVNGNVCHFVYWTPLMRVRQTLQMKSKRNKKKSKKVRMLGNDVTTWGDNHEAMRNLICLRS